MAKFHKRSVWRHSRYLLVALLVLTAWGGAETWLKSAHPFNSHALVPEEELCCFDSFSEPALASAILRQEANRLFEIYREQKSDETDSELVRRSLTKAQAAKLELDPVNGPPAERWPTVRPLENLQSEVQKLDSDLDCKLMLIYYERRSWDQFLDRYVHLVQTEPQNAVILKWAWNAMECSKSCGRTHEVLDALSHLARLHPEFKTAQGVRATLEDWRLAYPGCQGRLEMDEAD